MKLKFCGFKNKLDIKNALTCNVDYIGLIFAESKRRIDKNKAFEIVKDLDFGKVKLVGVFMNQSLNEVLEISEFINVDIIQIHGSESNEYLKELKSKTEKEIWRAIPGNEKSIVGFNNIPADLVLIDSTKGGGSGETADWKLISKYENKFNKPYMLAGGLSIDNIKYAIKILKPVGVDICSGIEFDGVKNLELMRKISRMVKNDG